MAAVYTITILLQVNPPYFAQISDIFIVLWLTYRQPQQKYNKDSVTQKEKKQWLALTNLFIEQFYR